MNAPVSLQHLLERTAQAFGVSLAQMRARNNGRGAALPAKLAFCWLARHRAGVAGSMAIAMKLAVAPDWVEAAISGAASCMLHDRDFADRLDEVVLECAVDTGVSQRTPYPLPQDGDAQNIAQKILESRRSAGLVSIDDIETLASAFLSLAVQDEFEPLLKAS